jgi:hypothetical protein
MLQAPIESLAALLQYSESFAKQMLVEAGEFHPFGAIVNVGGKVEALAGHIGVEFPKGQELYEFLQGAVNQLAAEKKILAYALVANVNVPAELNAPLPEGIRVHVVAPDYSRMIYTPYRSLSYRALRKFLAFLPLVEYAEEITVDVTSNAFMPAEA